jgi:hypothetical protein
MQTFLPYPDMRKSMSVLDYRRLGKQRVEALQIHNTLTGKSVGWRNHPAVLMWKDYEDALAVYMNTAIQEWVGRGYKNTMKQMIVPSYKLPYWFGDEKLHTSHQSNLLRKDPIHYGKLFNVAPDLPYYWPTRSS